MKTYLDIVRNILDNGISKQPTRMVDGKAVKVTNGTIGLPAQTFIHDMRTGFPALTTRKIAFRSTMVELEGFIKGITDKTWYQQRGCKFWDSWANKFAVAKDLIGNQEAIAKIIAVPIGGSKEEAEKVSQKTQAECNDLGPIYGYQWRKFGAEYYSPHSKHQTLTFGLSDGYPNGLPYWSDQLKDIVDKLKKNPYDRRMVCSAWNPNQMDMMALPPCHFAWNVVVYGDTISLIWHQRSCDLMCGVSHNIASYAALLCLLGKTAGLTPWMLKGDLNDCHIYENQIENAKEQLSREPRRLPLFSFKRDDPNFDIFQWTHKDVHIIDYDPHPKLKFEVTI